MGDVVDEGEVGAGVGRFGGGEVLASLGEDLHGLVDRRGCEPCGVEFCDPLSHRSAVERSECDFAETGQHVEAEADLIPRLGSRPYGGDGREPPRHPVRKRDFPEPRVDELAAYFLGLDLMEVRVRIAFAIELLRPSAPVGRSLPDEIDGVATLQGLANDPCHAAKNTEPGARNRRNSADVNERNGPDGRSSVQVRSYFW